ncbi:MAG: VWA domain-containing protein [Magnetococcales bacterium]|nr:VWA domain-containing protein [Magnetococcales bacterium]
MSDLHFAHPGWIHLLWLLVVLLVFLAFREWRADQVLQRFMGIGLQKKLVRGIGRWQKMVRLGFFALSLIFLTLALMRPQWGIHWITTPRSGVEIMVCLDVSQSMLAEDVAPNRLERAKAELRDLLPYLRGNQLGLIAFAGRASVLAPLTPDFGFFRLALDQASPRSVSRGGTRLEEPIQKAIAGFAGGGDVSRSIVLITDGEDQDSFPLEAAKEAAKRGIRILAIGIGSETGSEIVMTDPKTGVRSVKKDANGQPIKTRLDGRMLREIALITEGAYIPAGVGVLDLKEIYQRHIAPLTRGAVDGTRQTVQNEAFQWMVLLGFVSFLASFFSRFPEAGRGRILGIGMVLLLGFSSVSHALANEEPRNATDAQVQSANAPSPTPEVARTPREEYNLGLEKLAAKEFDAAQTALTSARNRAGTDGELRFRASYNLGWVEAGRADGKLKSDPKEALAGLNRAAAWFREAITLRKDHEESRHNLEVVLGKALALADQMAQSGKGDVASALDALVQEQRSFVEGIAHLVEGEGKKEGDAVDPGAKQVYRDFSARQLEIMTQEEAVGTMAGSELENIRKKKENERTPQEGMRLHQLELLLDDLHQARERMGQGRAALRGSQGGRAFHKGVAALAELKKGRERLLDLPAKLGALLTDGMELSRFTAMGPALEAAGQASPPWLTPELLQDLQSVILARSETVHQEVQAGRTASQPGTDAGQSPQLQEMLKEAEPLLQDVVSHYDRALAALKASDRTKALEEQRQALLALSHVRELFLAIKGLIELAWQDENRILGSLKPGQTLSRDEAREDVALQETNQTRMQRVGRKIVEELQQARTTRDDPAKQQEASKDSDTLAQQQTDAISRLERANALQAATLEKMSLAKEALSRLTGEGDATPSIGDGHGLARSRVRAVLHELAALRQLFFSVEEHLRQTVERQKDVMDEAQKWQPMADVEALKKGVGPLGERQGALAETTGAIRDALTQQVDTIQKMPADKGATPEANAKEKAQETVKRLQEVIDRVAQAKGDMQEAEKGLKEAKLQLPGVKEAQEKAIQALLQALALLAPPQAENKSDHQKQDSQGEQGKNAGKGEQKKEAEAAQKGEDKGEAKGGKDQRHESQLQSSGARMLQGVRDREVSRRRQRNDRKTMNYEPVEKDW